MMPPTNNTRTIVTRCGRCSVISAFGTDNLTAAPGDDWEELCIRYPDCASRQATVVVVGA